MIKGLSDKYEALSPHEDPGTMSCNWNPAAGEVEMGSLGPASGNTGQSCPVGELQIQ